MDSLGIALQNRSLDVVKQNTQISFGSENRAVVCHDIFQNTSKWEVVRTVCFCTSCHERNPSRNFHENHLGQLCLEFKKCGYWLEAFLFIYLFFFTFCLCKIHCFSTACQDDYVSCSKWKAAKHCEKNVQLMSKHCARSCDTCGKIDILS